ncbi:MAG TPA: leucyl aminopeptidase [Solirubrobacteraceae bacterium]|nr:leucyl aminopeptidase [Solirubrobacteraceae bacterium]
MLAPVNVEATTESPLATGADTIVAGVFDGEDIAHDLSGRALGTLLDSGEAQRDFKRLAVTHADGVRAILVGLGARTKFDAERARTAAGVVHRRATEIGARTLCWEVPHHVGDDVVEGLVEGTLLHAYRFERYKPSEDSRRVERLVVSAHHDVSGPVRTATILTAAQNRARDLGNTASNDLPPSALANYALELAARLEIGATVLDGDAIREMGMGAFAAVAQGSEQPARLIRLDYDGGGDAGGAEAPLIALIGKAVTFDSGGISLKPAGTMFEMKFDMCGGAAVLEAIGALAELRAPVRVLGLIGATENLPSGNAVKPGDIVRALDGTTVEVNNTDAEGRLVLGDCIAYARREGAERLVDVATLTGGIVVALGSTYAGLMSNDDAWADDVLAAGQRTGELVWRMPLHDDYAEMIKGRYGQIVNSTTKREATALTAGEFLHHFASNVPWAHLDIAGTAFDVRRPYFADKGATGYGVRLLVDLARGGGSPGGAGGSPAGGGGSPAATG